MRKRWYAERSRLEKGEDVAPGGLYVLAIKAETWETPPEEERNRQQGWQLACKRLAESGWGTSCSTAAEIANHKEEKVL